MNGSNLAGFRINVQWSKRSGKFEPNSKENRKTPQPQKKGKVSTSNEVFVPRTLPDYEELDSTSYDFSYDEKQWRELERAETRKALKRVKKK